MIDTELLAANSILKRGVRYRIPAPLFVKFFGKKTIPITITQLHWGTELKMAALLAEKGITMKMVEEADPFKFMTDHHRTVLRAVALATLNRQNNCRLRLLLRESALRRLTTWRLFELFMMVMQYSSTKSFTTITRLMLETRATKPNLGQEEKAG